MPKREVAEVPQAAVAGPPRNRSWGKCGSGKRPFDASGHRILDCQVHRVCGEELVLQNVQLWSNGPPIMDSGAHMENTNVYALGSNGSGQLGVGHREDLHSPSIVKGLNAHFGVYPTIESLRIAAGGNHTVFSCDDGRSNLMAGQIYGTDISTECVETSTVPESQTPREYQNRVKHIAATWTALFLVDDAATWVMGVGNGGELGLGPSVTEAKHLTPIPDFPPKDSKVVNLSSSMAHVVAILSNGEVWGWGGGRRGQLGMPAEIVWSPRRIEGILFPVKKAVCGKEFTCVVGEPERGLLSVIGSNGRDRFGVRSSAPAAVPAWKQITASWGSVFVLLQSGKVVAWGRNDHGQLPPPHLPLIAFIAAGSEHCVAITASTSPEVLAWGWGEHGNCGAPTDPRGDVSGDFNRIKVLGVPNVVFAGCSTTFIMARTRPIFPDWP